eukprot:TRINITY_DN2157_c0_g1_i1.p2 TRINITY_DN2157_c0_g1~~TRINITY_DN2157_c0_g1_i1.p2  ORF type:complete len:154 (-),score=14.80 TRINITY_DN2157_c0_g1_i1:165-626(-)
MFNGYLAPLEGHFVMKIDKKDLSTCPDPYCISVVSVHFQHGLADTENEFLAHVLSAIGSWPNEKGQSVPIGETIDFDLLIPSNPEYMLYEGSLTTPPCTEGVLWHIIRDPLPVSKDQVKWLQDAIGVDHDGISRNNRRIQPLHNRELVFHECV